MGKNHNRWKIADFSETELLESKIGFLQNGTFHFNFFKIVNFSKNVIFTNFTSSLFFHFTPQLDAAA